MSSFDFAVKDFFRKKKQTYPYLLAIVLVVAITEFLIYFTSSLGLNIFVPTEYPNKFYFSGSINKVYSEFNSFIQILLVILAAFVVIAVSTTLIINKKKDIAIMRALGTLPRKLYSFYLLEVYIVFFFGFLLGLICGLISFGISRLLMSSYYVSIGFHIDLIYTPLLFFSCCLGIFFVPGYTLRKIGKQKIIKTFSKDIPFDFDASKGLQFIPKWFSSLGINIKMSITNTIRKKGEFKRYLIVFSLISLITFTLGLGTFVLRTSSREWIHKSQGDNILIFGHTDVIGNYSQMYKMFSNPSIFVDNSMIDFTHSSYLFNVTDLDEIKNIDGVECFDERIVNFYEVQEMQGYHFFPDPEGGGEYRLVGQNREANIPIIGLNPENLIQSFEIEGEFFSNDDAFDNITIGDGLAFNLFDYALDQRLKLSSFGSTYHISGVIIDAFYSGYAGYMGINETRSILNLTAVEINFLALKIDQNSYSKVVEGLNNASSILGEDFTYMRLDSVFDDNLEFLSNLALYPMFLMIIIAILTILTLYNYQKSGIMEKARDFLIMKAIGSQNRSIRRILFLESIFVIVPSLLLSLGIGMILNSLVLFARVFLPPLFIPFMLLGILLGVFLIFNFFSLIPIMRKINKFSIKDFEIY